MTDGALALDHSPIPILMPSRIARVGPRDPDVAPACPLCGSPTVRRTTHSGPRAGIDYWGCTTFPACRGTTEVDGSIVHLGRGGAPTTSTGLGPSAAAVATYLETGSGATARPFAPAAIPAAPTAAAGTSLVCGAAAHTWSALALAARAAAEAARIAFRSLERAGTAGMDAARPALQRNAARLVDFGLDVIQPAQPVAAVGGRNVAGASAQAEFERRRSRHRLKMRAALPAVVAITVIAMLTLFLVLLSSGLLAAVVGALVAAVAGVWAIGRLPADALTWGSSADGQRRTADFLDELASAGYVVLHDRLIPGLRSNVDHVAIGPAGVFVIETKNLRGKLTIAGEKLFVGERTRTGVIDETYRQALAVQVCLSDRLNALRSTVRPILCVHRTAQLLLDNEVQGVRVVSGPQLARFVRRLPALFDAETVQDLATAADARLKPAVP